MAEYRIQMNTLNSSGEYDVLYPFTLWNQDALSVISNGAVKQQVILETNLETINTAVINMSLSNSGNFQFSLYEDISTNKIGYTMQGDVASHGRCFIYLTNINPVGSTKLAVDIVGFLETSSNNLSSVFIEYALLDITNNSFYFSCNTQDDMVLATFYVI